MVGEDEPVLPLRSTGWPLRCGDECIQVPSANPIGAARCLPLPGRVDFKAPDWIQLLIVPGTTCREEAGAQPDAISTAKTIPRTTADWSRVIMVVNLRRRWACEMARPPREDRP